jgi:LmbE family N-acetylglucosaminyl deacetylase
LYAPLQDDEIVNNNYIGWNTSKRLRDLNVIPLTLGRPDPSVTQAQLKFYVFQLAVCRQAIQKYSNDDYEDPSYSEELKKEALEAHNKGLAVLERVLTTIEKNKQTVIHETERVPLGYGNPLISNSSRHTNLVFEK